MFISERDQDCDTKKELAFSITFSQSNWLLASRRIVWGTSKSRTKDKMKEAFSLMRLCRQPAMNGKMLRELALQVCFSKKKKTSIGYLHIAMVYFKTFLDTYSG